MLTCLQCCSMLKPSGKVYCSNHCQREYEYERYISRWKEGLEDGSRGIKTKNLSEHLKRYIHERFKHACVNCGWSEISEFTGKTPLEIDHIDGDSENNKELNLRLLCPNCHSLTVNHRNLNKGKGRSWRRAKYLKAS